MADQLHDEKPLRVLLSEGSSTSAREAITMLGLAGHIVEVCDPSPVCLGRFSRFVGKFHRCPALGDDPAGYLSFIETLLAERPFDVLLPIHEQGFLFARVSERFKGCTGLALPSFESYRAAHSKAGFNRLLGELDLPQPPTRIVKSAGELRDAAYFPCVVKTSIGTASRGIWFVRNDAGLEHAAQDLEASQGFADEVLVQDLVAGTTEKAQAVFCRGKLLGFHASKQLAGGAGGGEAIKQSVRRPLVRAHVATIGERLGWHGALSVDTIVPDGGTHLFIDCNPRLVEPMSAGLAGLDLVELLLQVSQGKAPQPAPESREGLRTHLAMQAVLGCAVQCGTRREIFRQCVAIAAGHEPYADSVEELTPLRHDWISAIPLAMTAFALLANPRLGSKLSKKGWGTHLLGARSIRFIESENFPEPPEKSYGASFSG
ncbi:hypothetical protein [uncultured Bradyrhizobium sp.]|uniref:hypothetical protein n=1 Tax=uncultured Bradyrhizobium sp. TaxID=199684 RepID=UPI0035CA2FE2